MKLKVLNTLILLLWLSAAPLYGQKEINNIAFHDKLGFNFNTPNLEFFSTEWRGRLKTASTISDVNGNLLFYTKNTRRVFNKNHEIMRNGDGLVGYNYETPSTPPASVLDLPWSDQSIIIPKPGNANRYYVITTGNYFNQGRLFYSEVDMSLDGGLGAVVAKNVPFFTGTIMGHRPESIAAVKQKNSDNVWLLYKVSYDTFGAFLITGAGIMPPVLSPPIPETGFGLVRSNMVFSPDGKKIALSESEDFPGGSYFGMADFDSQTGVVSNLTFITRQEWHFDDFVFFSEFSPSGRFFYVFKNAKVYQYDVNNLTTPLYEVSLEGDVNSAFLAPDGKIYFLVTDYVTAKSDLYAVNRPELASSACEIKRVDSGRDYKETYVKYLKTFALNPSKEITCVNSNTVFNSNSVNDIISVTWDFGDGTSGTGLNTTHNYASPGVYQAVAVLNTSNGVEYIRRMVVVYGGVVAHAALEESVCIDPGGSAFDLQQFEPSILGSQSSADFSVSYFETLQNAQSNIDPIDPHIILTQDRSYFAKVVNRHDINQTCAAYTEIQFHTYPKPVLDIVQHYFLCENSTVVLNSAPGFDQYLWSTGATTPSITVSSPGTYWVSVKENHGSVICATVKNIEVVLSGTATIVNVDISDFTSENNSFLVLVSGLGDYQYSLDGVHYQDSNAFYGLGSGEFTVYVRDKNGCGITQEDVFLLSYPNFFTPNEDGINDVWTIKYSYTDPDLTISIFDRYGKLIKVLSGVDSSWDGTLNNIVLPSTDYWFVAKRGNGKRVKGHFSLKR